MWARVNAGHTSACFFELFDVPGPWCLESVSGVQIAASTFIGPSRTGCSLSHSCRSRLSSLYHTAIAHNNMSHAHSRNRDSDRDQGQGGASNYLHTLSQVSLQTL